MAGSVLMLHFDGNHQLQDQTHLGALEHPLLVVVELVQTL